MAIQIINYTQLCCPYKNADNILSLISSCPDGYEGAACEIKKESALKGYVLPVVISGSVLAPLALLACCFCCLLACIKRRRKEKQKKERNFKVETLNRYSINLFQTWSVRHSQGPIYSCK